MILTLVRHGETEANVADVTQGQMNSQLTGLGVEQAKKLADRLKDEKFDVVYVSDLDRCVKTAEQILRFHPDVDVIYSRILRERHAGVLEGRPKEETLKKTLEIGFAHFRPDAGESFADVQVRAVRFYHELIEKHLDRSVLVIGHGGFFAALLLYLLNKPMSYENFMETRPSNCAVTVLEVDKDKNHTVRLLNCVKHMG